jgi:hypothetical protein
MLAIETVCGQTEKHKKLHNRLKFHSCIKDCIILITHKVELFIDVAVVYRSSINDVISVTGPGFHNAC